MLIEGCLRGKFTLYDLEVFLVKTWLQMVQTIEILFAEKAVVGRYDDFIYFDQAIERLELLEGLQKLAHIAGIIDLKEMSTEADDQR